MRSSLNLLVGSLSVPETAVVADTCHYLPKELVSRLGISLVSLHVLLPGGEDRLESSWDDFTDFYDILTASKTELPSTSQPSPGEFLAVWEPLLDEGKEIVSLHLSAGISGTFSSALQARDLLGDRAGRVQVVDTRTTAGGEGLIVLAAAAAAKAGHNAEGCAKAAEAARDKFRIRFAVDTLEYFERGGRIGRAQAWVGSALKIKPILTLEEEVTPVERVRTSSKAYARMVEYLEMFNEEGLDGWCVQHIRSPDQCAALVGEGRRILGHEPRVVSEVGPVLGVYAGPGMLGIGAIPRSLGEV
jgi:DegV family protein with EDD domain